MAVLGKHGGADFIVLAPSLSEAFKKAEAYLSKKYKKYEITEISYDGEEMEYII